MFGQGSPGFGAPSTNNPGGNAPAPAFGAPAFGAPASNVFGTGGSNPSFGPVRTSNPTAFGGNTGSPAFGTGMTGSTPAPTFGGAPSMFGQPSTTATVFGNARPATAFGGGTNAGSLFGTSSTPMFSSTTSDRAPPTTTTTMSTSFLGPVSRTTTSPFESSAGGIGTFGGTTSTSVFGATTSSATVFGNVSQPPSGGNAASVFRGSSQGGFGHSATSASVFGSRTASTSSSTSTARTPATSSSGFANVPTSSAASVFGAPATTATGIFAAVTSSSVPSSNVFGTFIPKTNADSAVGNRGTGGTRSGQAAVFGSPPVYTSSTTKVTSSGSSSKSVFDSSAGTSNVFRSSSSKVDRASDEVVRAPVKSILKTLVEEENEQDETKSESKVPGLFGKPAHDRMSSTGSAREKSLSPTPGGSSSHRPSHSPDRRRLIRRNRDGTSKDGDLFGAAISGIRSATATKEADVKKSSDAARQRRRISLEETRTKVAIVCKEIPAEHNNKEALRRHFRKYGTVKKVFSTPARQSANIHFETHEEAELAKKEGKSLGPNFPEMQIFWAAHNPRTSSDVKTTEKADKPYSTSDDLVLKPLSGDLNDELASMQGTADIQSDIHFLERPSRGRKEEQPRTSKSVKPVRSKGNESRKQSVVPSRSSKSVKAPSAKPTASKSEKGSSHISMKALANAVGHTAAERYEILDNRDKIIRMAIGKPTDFTTAEATKGTCQDMCPEKERYVREERRRLNVFEIVPGTDLAGQNPKVDHARAVKEYSRSSADQDMPLPNELRPPEVLSRTMDYLTNNIMDLGGDGKWGDWYEYLWDRTRSIRKDITQQQLCDLTAVDVTEKNVRFHIYCAERLCEEDASSFDEKINNENLTKCLQTLKELYSDLEKKGTACPREDEFRAYMVLMNLNEGDTLREVQQLRAELRGSQAVRFATAVHSAVNTNNYVKFFKYVRQASFLYGCVVHRYFNQVRAKGLQTMLKAYKGKSTPMMYPLSELVRLLCFESLEDAALFCRHHGLSIHNQSVAMDRTRFVHPETAPAPRRALHLIEGKLNTSVGEVVNGGPLPPNYISQPTSSFDEHGRYIAGDVGVVAESEIRETPQPVVPQAIVQPIQEQPAPTTGFMPTNVVVQPTISLPIPKQIVPSETAREYSHEAIKEVAKEMFHEVISEQINLMSQSLIRSIQIYMGNAGWIYDNVERDTVGSTVRELCNEAVEDLKKNELEKQARRKAEISAIKAKVSVDVSASLLDEVVRKECKKIADDEFSHVQSRLQHESEWRETEAIAKEILDIAVQEETCQVAEDVFETDVIERQQQMEEAHRATQLLVMSRFLKRWRNQLAGRQRLKRSIQTFPPAPSMDTPENQVMALIPESTGISHNALHLGMNAHVTLDCSSTVVEKSLKLKYNITLFNYWKRLRHEKAWAPVNLGDGFYKSLLHSLQSENRNIKAGGALYWKLVLSLPDVGPDSSIDDEFAQRTIMCCDWLRSKFRKGTVPSPDQDGKTEVLSLYRTPVHIPPATRGSLGVCVRVIKGFPEDEDACLVDRKRFLGTSAVLFYIGEVDQENSEFYLGEVQSRLLHVLESLPKSSSLPLVLLTPADSPVEVDELNLDIFIEEGMISSFKVVTLEADIEDPESNKNVYDSLLWTTEHCSPPPGLTSETLHDVTENTLTTEYFTPLYQNLTKRRRNGLLHQRPQLLITYYNHLIAHIAEVVSDSSLQDFSWPIAEFSSNGSGLPSADWNTADQLSFLRDMVLSLQLPEYDGLDSAATEWSQALADVWEYVTAVAEGGHNNVAFFSKIKWILRKFEREFEATCQTCLRLDECEPEVCNVPWTDILQACVENRLSQAEWIDPALDDDSAELMVHFVPSSMERYKPPAEWLDRILEITEEVAPALDETILRSAKRKLNRSQQEPDSPPKFQRLDTNSAFIDLSVTSEMCLEADNAAHHLNNLLAEEKRKNKEFEDYLQRSLISNTMSPVLQQTFRSPDFQATVHGRSLSQSDYEKCRTPSAKQLHSTPTVQRTPMNRQMPVKNISPAHPKRGFSIETDLDDLNSSLNSLRKADIIYEMRLKSFLTDT